MILILDNYDSFTYNLYQMLGSITTDLKVVRNDAVTVADVEAMAPDGIVISPGPGRPEDAGICPEVICEGHVRFWGSVWESRPLDSYTVRRSGMQSG